jgi:uncharacterized protein (TIGR04255 family)
MFKIDLTESFPLLARAPIVEAVIEIRARAETPWEERAITQSVKTRLKDYPGVLSGRAVQFKMEVALPSAQAGPAAPGKQSVDDMGWRGLRCESADKLHIAQFNRDGFVFSRLAPYESWDQFQQEGLRLWQLHRELAQPTEVERLGLRFINRIAVKQDGLRLEDYLEAPPKPPRGMDLPFAGFLHHDTLSIPGYSYGINFAQTVQPPQGPEAGGLILDIDVFTTQPFNLDEDKLKRHLSEMRWLKNKVFFGSITQRVLETIK